MTSGGANPWHPGTEVGSGSGTENRTRPAGLAAGPAAAASGTKSAGLRSLTRVRGVLREIFRPLVGSGPPPEPQPRRTLDLRLVPSALVAWIAAVLCARLAPAVGFGISAGALLAAAGIVALFRHPSGRARLLSTGVPLCILALVALSTAQATTSSTAGPIAAAIERETVVTAQLRLTSDPKLSPNADRFSGGERYLIEAQLEAATAAGQQFEADTPVLILADGRWADVRLGQVVSAAGRLLKSEPGADVAALLAVRAAPVLEAEARTWQQWTSTLRRDFLEHCAALSPNAAGLLPGMVLGDRSALAPEVESAMKRTGLTHLTAVSGANCSILVGFVVIGCYALQIPRWAAAAISLVALAGFVLLVRPDPSVLRAALMGTIGIAAVLSGRGRRSAALLSITVVVLLIVDPWLATSYAFVLSVLATTGLIVFGHNCAIWLARWLPWWLAQALAVPLAAQVFCAPVILLLQPQLSTYSVLANVLAAPVIAPVTILGMLAVLAVAIFSPVATPLIGIAGAAAEWVAFVAQFFSTAPGAAMPWPQGPVGVALLAVVSLSSMALLRALSMSAPRHSGDGGADASGTGRAPVHSFSLNRSAADVRSRRRNGVRWYLSALLVGLILGLGPALLLAGAGAQNGRSWSVVACDVGQGDAFVIRTGPQSAIVVDTGPEPASMDRCLRNLSVSTIDVLVLTHMHADHTGGLRGALSARRVHQVLVSSAEDNLPRMVQSLLDEHDLKPARAAAGQGGTSGLVQWQVLWPSANGVPGDENNASVVLAASIETGGPPMTMLLVGDLEEEGLARLIASSGSEPAADVLGRYRRDGLDVLKIAHHGARNGGAAMIEGFDPAIALISVGKDNDYGHPHPRILRSLQEAGSTVGRTDLDGQIYLDKEGQTLMMWSTR